MKRITFLLLATAVALLAITIVATRNYAIEDKHAGHHKGQPEKAKPTLKEDGSQNPASIPDVDAYEILFKILSASNPNDKLEDQRKKSYLRVAGFNDGEAAALFNAAYEYKRQITPLDTEVHGIKNQHWPNPSANVRAQLLQLQRQKEGILEDTVVTPLKAQLRNYDLTGKLDRFLMNEIKGKTKGFAVALPTRRISRLEDHLSNFFSVSAQAGGCDASLYIYSSTWVDYNNGYVYCDNSYSAPYNNCGHTYNLTYTMAGLSSPSFSLGTFDGLVQTFANVEGYCEQAFILFGNGSFNAGNNYSEVNVAPHVKIIGFSGELDVTTESDIGGQIEVSDGFPGGNISFLLDEPYNPNSLSLTPAQALLLL